MTNQPAAGPDLGQLTVPAAVDQAGPGPALDQLAASPAGPGRYAALRDRPVHQRAGGWVAARAADVDAALSAAALTVAPPVPAGTTSPARQLQARMARFS